MTKVRLRLMQHQSPILSLPTPCNLRPMSWLYPSWVSISVYLLYLLLVWSLAFFALEYFLSTFSFCISSIARTLGLFLISKFLASVAGFQEKSTVADLRCLGFWVLTTWQLVLKVFEVWSRLSCVNGTAFIAKLDD